MGVPADAGNSRELSRAPYVAYGDLQADDHVVSQKNTKHTSDRILVCDRSQVTPRLGSHLLRVKRP
jgi:hypothetical protein